MSNDRTNITTPVGRVVMGNMYKPNTTDAEGKPLTTKTGPNAGQARVNYFFALAIPKNPGENHWAYTEWGKQIWGVGCRAFPQQSQTPHFAWKIEDGDSMVPNKRGRKPAETEGWPGNWIVKFNGGFAPKIYRQENNGFVQVTEEDWFKPGYFAQVAFSVDGNGSQSQPGVYLNPSMVCFRAYGPEIVFGPDVNEAGFGAAPLPAGASLMPPPSNLPMPASPAAAQALPPYVGMPPAIPVMPNPQFLQVPPPAPVYPINAGVAQPSYPQGIPAPASPGAMPVPLHSNVPAPPPAVPSAPAYRMTEKAGGASREAYHTAGWSDAQLIQQGMMTI